MNNQPIPINTTITEAPVLQTVMQDGLSPVTTIVNAPWVNVTSVNGMVGDVVVAVSLTNFAPHTFYPKNTAILQNGALYYARQDFTSGDSFNVNDWLAPEFSQVQADWNEKTTTSNSFIKNKPTNVSQFTNDSNYCTVASVDSKINTAKSEINGQITPLSTKVSGLETNVSTLTSSLNNKVDKVSGKALSTNDFTNDYKKKLDDFDINSIIDTIKSQIFEQTYPVGSIYTTTDLSSATAVAQALGGGTWEAYGAGRVLVGYNSNDYDFYPVGWTGGEKDHKLTVNEMPKHHHDLNGNTDYMGIDGWGGTAYGAMISGDNYRWKVGQQDVGGDVPHNNLQPYIVVYRWRRTK